MPSAKISYYYKKNFADFKMEQMHIHEKGNFEIMFVRSGKCIVSVPDEQLSLSEGHFVLLGNCCPHSLSAVSAQILNIEFYINMGGSDITSVFEECPALTELFSKSAVLLADKSEVCSALLSLIDELRENGEGLCSDLLFSRLLIELSRSFLRADDDGSAYVAAARDYIKRHFCEKLPVSEIASAVGLNRSYLQTLFKKITGKTILEYINSLRIEKACFIMKNTDLPVVDIAADCGFSSRQHFMYIFKKQTGLTARQYRTGRVNYEQN